MRILYNGKILTLNPNQPSASAIAIDGDQILAVGSDEEILALSDPHVVTQDLEGQTVWPGMTDAHIHFEKYALNLQYVDCETTTRAECLERVRLKATKMAAGHWLRGHGWNQNNWDEGFGSAADLDRIAPQVPVYLTAKSLHAAWGNSAALRAAGINENTPDPEGGKILRDSTGKPTGILLESAMRLVESQIPVLTDDQLQELILEAQANLWKIGLTGIHDFDQKRCFTALQKLDSDDRLRLRVIKSIPLELLPNAATLGLQTGFGSNYLHIGSVKCFADGALGPRTAAMLTPFEEEPENCGLLLLDAEQIVEAGQEAVQSGLNLAIHAIGDRANHEVLNAYTRLRQYENEWHLPHLRHRIEHVQLLHPDDFGRLSQLGIIASVQPIHATSDMHMADRYWGNRSTGAYAYGTLRDLGTALAFGSDAPVESPNPFLGIHAAVTRQRLGGEPGPGGWYPAQRLSLMEALQGFTTGPAFAAYLEHRLGRLMPGFFADLIVLPKDPFSQPAEALHSIHPVATMVAGEWVWEAA